MKPKLLATAAYYLAFIILGLLSAVEGPVLLQLARHTHSRIDQISLIFLFGSLGYLIGSFISGRLYDRLPGHRFMAAIVLVLALLAVLVPVIRILWILVAVILLLGIAKAALDVGCNTLLLWVHDKQVGPFMNGLHAFFGIGAFISPLVVAQVVSFTGDIHWVYWSFVIACLPVAALIGSLPSPAQRAAPTSGGPTAVPFVPILLMALCFALYVGAEVGYGNWLYTYATTTGLGTKITGAYMTSAFWGFFTLARLAGIWISTRLRPGTILFVDLFGCLASVGLILLYPNSTTVLWIGSISVGIFMASIFASQLTLVEQRIHITGAITSWFLVGSSVGGMLVPWLIGQVFVPFGPLTMMRMVFGTIMLHLLVLTVYTGHMAARRIRSAGPTPI